MGPMLPPMSVICVNHVSQEHARARGGAERPYLTISFPLRAPRNRKTFPILSFQPGQPPPSHLADTHVSDFANLPYFFMFC